MTRRALAPGELGSAVASPYMRDADGKWTRAPTARKAQRWRAVLRYRDHDGALRTVERFAPRRDAAEAAAKQAVQEALSGSHGKGRLTARSTFGEAVERWRESLEREDSGAAALTRRDYLRVYGKHLKGADIMRTPIAFVNVPSYLRRFLRGIADSNGSGVAKHAKVILGSALALAVQDGAIAYNAIREVGTVKAEGGLKRLKHLDHKRALTRPERRALLRYVTHQAVQTLRDGRDPRSVRTAWAVADLVAYVAATGCRIGEALSLRWADVDLSTGRVIVQEGKTESARRRVDLPAWALARLRRRAEYLPQGASGFVFCSPARLDPEAPWDQANAGKRLRVAYDGAGFPWMSTHTLRRTAATLLDAAGAGIADIAGQLGHADPSLTAKVYLDRNLSRSKAHLSMHL